MEASYVANRVRLVKRARWASPEPNLPGRIRSVWLVPLSGNRPAPRRRSMRQHTYNKADRVLLGTPISSKNVIQNAAAHGIATCSPIPASQEHHAAERPVPVPTVRGAGPTGSATGAPSTTHYKLRPPSASRTVSRLAAHTPGPRASPGPPGRTSSTPTAVCRHCRISRPSR